MRVGQLTRRLGLGLWLVAVWLVLWRDLSAANVLSGIVVAVAAMALFPLPAAPALEVRVVPLLRFIGSVLISVIRANVVVAWEVVTPKNRINEAVVTVELASHHPVVITMVSHAIGLAPGTMVIDIDEPTEPWADTDGDPAWRPTRLFVHVLHLRDVEEVRAEVLNLERLALAAVGGADDPPAPTADSAAEARAR